MHCYLHIGLAKTATTSIQSFLYLNEKLLQEKSIFLTKCTGPPNNMGLAITAYDINRRDEFTQGMGIHSTLDMESCQRDAVKILKSEVAEIKLKNPNGTILFSSEHLQARLTSCEEVECLKRVLTQIGISETTVIVYLRDPPILAQSLYSTALKVGVPMQEPPDSSDYFFHNACNHRQTIERFGSVFGMENMIVRLFERSELKNGNILDDFLQILGIHEDVSYQVPEKENESLSGLGVQLMASLNQIAKIKNINSRIVREAIIDNTSGIGYSIPKDLYDKYQKEFNASNEWVRAHFFSEKERLFLSKYRENPAGYSINEGDVDCICRIFVSLAESKEKEIRALEQALEKLRGHIIFKGYGLISKFKRKVAGLFKG